LSGKIVKLANSSTKPTSLSESKPKIPTAGIPSTGKILAFRALPQSFSSMPTAKKSTALSVMVERKTGKKPSRKSRTTPRESTPFLPSSPIWKKIPMMWI